MGRVDMPGGGRIDESAARAMAERALGDGKQEFGSFFLSRLLGFKIGYGESSCIVEFEAIAPLFNPQGSLHGGIMATAMDVSMGHLLHHVTNAGGSTLEIKIQYLAPVTAGIVRCEGSFLRQGHKLSFLQSHARR